MSSVKFEKKEETVRALGEKSEDLAHRVGERLTGGKSKTGYLAVRFTSAFFHPDRRARDVVAKCSLSQLIGLPRAAAVQPDADQDAYLGHLVCASRIPRLMDRA